MSAATADVMLRVVPAEFRGPGFSVERNNVYQLMTNAKGEPARRLVTQLA